MNIPCIKLQVTYIHLCYMFRRMLAVFRETTVQGKVNFCCLSTTVFQCYTAYLLILGQFSPYLPVYRSLWCSSLLLHHSFHFLLPLHFSSSSSSFRRPSQYALRSGLANLSEGACPICIQISKKQNCVPLEIMNSKI
jgi:hypothetical protein